MSVQHQFNRKTRPGRYPSETSTQTSDPESAVTASTYVSTSVNETSVAEEEGRRRQHAAAAISQDDETTSDSSMSSSGGRTGYRCVYSQWSERDAARGAGNESSNVTENTPETDRHVTPSIHDTAKIADYVTSIECECTIENMSGDVPDAEPLDEVEAHEDDIVGELEPAPEISSAAWSDRSTIGDDDNLSLQSDSVISTPLQHSSVVSSKGRALAAFFELFEKGKQSPVTGGDQSDVREDTSLPQAISPITVDATVIEHPETTVELEPQEVSPSAPEMQVDIRNSEEKTGQSDVTTGYMKGGGEDVDRGNTDGSYHGIVVGRPAEVHTRTNVRSRLYEINTERIGNAVADSQHYTEGFTLESSMDGHSLVIESLVDTYIENIFQEVGVELQNTNEQDRTKPSAQGNDAENAVSASTRDLQKAADPEGSLNLPIETVSDHKQPDVATESVPNSGDQKTSLVSASEIRAKGTKIGAAASPDRGSADEDSMSVKSYTSAGTGRSSTTSQKGRALVAFWDLLEKGRQKPVAEEYSVREKISPQQVMSPVKVIVTPETRSNSVVSSPPATSDTTGAVRPVVFVNSKSPGRDTHAASDSAGRAKMTWKRLWGRIKEDSARSGYRGNPHRPTQPNSHPSSPAGVSKEVIDVEEDTKSQGSPPSGYSAQ